METSNDMARAGNGFLAATETLMRQVPGVKATTVRLRMEQFPLSSRSERAPVDGLPTSVESFAGTPTVSFASRDQMAMTLPTLAESRVWPPFFFQAEDGIRDCLK